MRTTEVAGRGDLKDACCRALEALFKAGQEQGIGTVLVLLCVWIVQSERPAALVRRLYQVREGFLEKHITYDEDSEYLQRMMLKMAVSPRVLRLSEGRKLVGFFFQAHDGMAGELLKVIRNDIAVNGRPGALQAYGEVVHRAWKGAAGARRLHLEQALDGLVEATVLARTPELHGRMLGVLGYLLERRLGVTADARELDGALCRAFAPVVFPAACAANPAVRANAVSALAAAFPLQDPCDSREQNDARIEQALVALGAAMLDPCPSVRAAAAAGAARALCGFLEIVPPAWQTTLLDRLCAKLAHDAASSRVRAAAAAALAALAAAPMARQALPRFLPRLPPLLRDPSPRVRAAALDLLTELASGGEEMAGGGVLDLATVEDIAQCAARGPAAVARPAQQLLGALLFSPDGDADGRALAAAFAADPAAGAAACRALAAGLVQSADEDAGTLLVSLATALFSLLCDCAPGAPAGALAPEAWEAALASAAHVGAVLAEGFDVDEGAGVSQLALDGVLATCAGPAQRAMALAAAAAFGDAGARGQAAAAAGEGAVAEAAEAAAAGGDASPAAALGLLKALAVGPRGGERLAALLATAVPAPGAAGGRRKRGGAAGLSGAAGLVVVACALSDPSLRGAVGPATLAGLSAAAAAAGPGAEAAPAAAALAARVGLLLHARGAAGGAGGAAADDGGPAAALLQAVTAASTAAESLGGAAGPRRKRARGRAPDAGAGEGVSFVAGVLAAVADAACLDEQVAGERPPLVAGDVAAAASALAAAVAPLAARVAPGDGPGLEQLGAHASRVQAALVGA